MPVHASSRIAIAALSAGGPEAQLDARDDLGFRLEIELKDGKAPDSFRIFKAGENTSTKGNYLFTETSQSACLAYQAKRGMRTLVDYEHASRYATFAADPQRAGRAACRVKLECKSGELWATAAKWTKAGREAVESGEQEFFSPVFDYDRETMVIGAVTSIGLTATPALDNLTPLAAKDGATPGAADMDELKKFLAELSKQMALKADASSTEVLLSMVQLKNDNERILTALDAKSVSEAVGKIEGHKANTAAVAELREKSKQQEVSAAKLRLDSMLEAALKEKRIAPAERDFLGKFDEVALTAYLNTRAPGSVGGVSPTPAAGGNGVVPVPDGKGGTLEVALKDEDLAVARLMPGAATPEALKKLAELKAKGIATKPAE